MKNLTNTKEQAFSRASSKHRLSQKISDASRRKNDASHHSVRRVAILVATCLLLTHFEAAAQKRDTIAHFDAKASSIFATDTQLVQGIGWVRSHFLDNWFVQLQGGGQLYYGTEDRLGNFADRLTFNGEVHIGRWVFPMLGYRIGMGYGYAHGFISKSTYNTYPSPHGWGQCEGSLGGYYWSYDKNDNLYIQRWKYYYLTPDVLVNLSYAKDYRPERHWVSWAYAGVGVYFGLSEGYDGPAGVVSADADPNRSAEAHIGFIEKFQLNEHWNFYVDARLSFMHRTFDREWVQGYEKALGIADPMLNLHFGVDYNFHWRSEKVRTKWYAKNFDANVDEGYHVPRHLYTAHQFSYELVQYMDTIYAYDTLSEFSPGYDALLNELARQKALDAIDSAKKAFDDDCAEATLDDILGRHLLPYEMVLYDLDKWNIRPSEETRIARMASVIKAFPDNQFLIIGSADSKTGTIKRNDFLSHERADTVYNQLVHRYGVNPAQLQRVYLGGILDYEPYQLNRATVIIMNHPKVLSEFNKLSMNGRRSGSFMLASMDTIFAYERNANLRGVDDMEAVQRAKESIEAALKTFDEQRNKTLNEILESDLIPYEMVFFDLDRWEILQQESTKIARMAAIMKAFPNHKFILYGSADSQTGTAKRNDFLSRNRADVVYNRLVMDYGIKPSQLKREYLGGILDYKPYQLNRATVIIMDHPAIMREFRKLKSQGRAGGSAVQY